MNLSEILQRLQNVRKTRNGYQALCPSHTDIKQSLSVKESNGRILLKCFAGCDTQEIVSAMNIELKDLFSEQKKVMANNNFQSKKIVSVYQYTDENGNLLYENVRYEPKDFQQRKPSGNGYDYSLNGVRRVPYRLPELIKAVADDTDVFLCEGEKDADNLRKIGLTTSSFKNWKPEFNSFIKGANIILLLDHDKSGVKQASAACKILFGKMASLKMLDLFADELLPEKHGRDVSDWIETQKAQDLNDEEIAERLCIFADNQAAWQQGEQENDTNAQDVENDFPSLFIAKSANAWIEEAKLKPMPKMLFDEFWREGEVCILFGDTGKGKTILAVQIADSISNGAAINNFKLEAEKQKILYFDFELSEKQFEKRYSVEQGDIYTNHFLFDENFQRIEINRFCKTPKHFKDFESYLFSSLEYEIAVSGAKVVIVDNITYLKGETEKAKDALPLMKELIKLKMKYGVSIMALAHTPKRDLSKPITINDLQGSKMLSNFCDNIFAIGESAKDKNLRYLKQIKPRNAEIIYDAENVAVCQITKPDNFLMFDFLGYGSECKHLKQMTESDKKDLIDKIKNLSALGESQRKIANELGIPLTSVNRYLNLKK